MTDFEGWTYNLKTCHTNTMYNFKQKALFHTKYCCHTEFFLKYILREAKLFWKTSELMEISCFSVSYDLLSPHEKQ